VTLRRYAPMKKSAGTQWPREIVDAAYALHGGCVGPKAGMPGECTGQLEPDHIRASGAIGKKSRSTLDNCAPLCGAHHRLKTREGRTWRPRLIEVVERAISGELVAGPCAHVEPQHGCVSCMRRADPLQLSETGWAPGELMEMYGK
jgi:hypothetical protein